jgi:hypothetical protein
VTNNTITKAKNTNKIVSKNVTDNTIIKAKNTNKIVSKNVTDNTIIKDKYTNKIVSKNLTDCAESLWLKMVFFGIFQASLIFMAKLCHL